MTRAPAAPPAGWAGWDRLHDLARDSGLAAGLRALTEEHGAGDTPFGPAGHAIVLATPDAVARGGAELRWTVDLDGDTVLVVRRRPGPERPGSAGPGWAAGIAWLRLGASRWLLRLCVAHARERTIGPQTLLQQQLVQASVADALTAQLEAEALLDAGPPPTTAVLAQAHARIQAADRIALSLLGASGFAAGLPSHTAWVSELLADAYPGPGADAYPGPGADGERR